MDSASTSNKLTGVIGAGSFGTAIANLLAENGNVIIYTRNKDEADNINKTHIHKNISFSDKIVATNSIEEITSKCTLIFPVVPSDGFLSMLEQFAPYLKPSHMLIHATKGLHTEKKIHPEMILKKEEVLTMSELIERKTGVVRIGCLAGPNLSKEINEKQPAATVIASRFNEVIAEGHLALRSQRFKVYGSNELRGVELAGVLKNYVAIASGMLTGMGFGDNAKAFLITRGMAELIYIAKALGYNQKAFLGIAGIGDLIATCNSPNSRNFRVGYNLSQGKNLTEIIEEIGEVAEGVKTLQIVKALQGYGFQAPLASVLHRIIFEQLPIQKGIDFLMKFPADNDAEYI